MGNQAITRIEKVFLQQEAVFGTIPNVAGVPTLTGAAACHFIRCSLQNPVPTIQRPDKTGSRGVVPGVAGRGMAQWSLDMGLSGGGLTGGAKLRRPPCWPILSALFGTDPIFQDVAHAPVAEANAVEIVYKMSDVIKSFCLWDYREPSTMSQRVGAGLVVTNAQFNLGQDAATWSAQGMGKWVVASDRFPTLTAGSQDLCGMKDAGAGGTFPACPVPSFLDGGLVIGFTGAVTAAAAPITNIRQATVNFQMNNAVRRDTFGAFRPDGTEGGVSVTSIDFGMYDEDTVGMTALRAAAEIKTPIDVTLQIGTVPGNIWTLTVKQVQLGAQNLSDNMLRWTCDYGQSQANESVSGSRDEVTLTLT